MHLKRDHFRSSQASLFSFSGMRLKHLSVKLNCLYQPDIIPDLSSTYHSSWQHKSQIAFSKVCGITTDTTLYVVDMMIITWQTKITTAFCSANDAHADFINFIFLCKVTMTLNGMVRMKCH